MFPLPRRKLSAAPPRQPGMRRHGETRREPVHHEASPCLEMEALAPWPPGRVRWRGLQRGQRGELEELEDLEEIDDETPVLWGGRLADWRREP